MPWIKNPVPMETTTAMNASSRSTQTSVLLATQGALGAVQGDRLRLGGQPVFGADAEDCHGAIDLGGASSQIGGRLERLAPGGRTGGHAGGHRTSSFMTAAVRRGGTALPTCWYCWPLFPRNV